MNEQKAFQQLKERVLETYRNAYPYFQGDWKNFSSKDIRQLIDLIETQLNENVSEKWIYTHLKPETNEKLPRKDMLDIFSRFAGFSDWNEFVYKNQVPGVTSEIIQTNEISTRSQSKKWLFLLLLIPLTGFGIHLFNSRPQNKTVEIKNEFTREPVHSDEIEVYKVSENKKTPVEIVDSKIEVDEKDEKILIESPYFETKEIEISETQETVYVKPEDYALVLKTFIHSDLKNWEDRKEKLNKILSDDLEVIILLKENLGAEHLNKKEFSGKLIVPTSETKKMKILNLETNNQKQITFIRIQQL